MDPKNPKNFGIFVENEYISNEEITSFQNQYMQMLQYAKSFMNYVMKNVIQETKVFSDLFKIQQDEVSELRKTKDLFKVKKFNLQKDLLI